MKPATRKAVEAFILKHLDIIDPSKTNSQLYTNLFKSMSDAALLRLIEKRVPIYMPNDGPVYIDPPKVVEAAKREFGYDFYQHAYFTDPKTGVVSKTVFKHMVMDVPVRRQTQMIEKKASMPVHNRTIDKMTNQPTGASKSSSFSFPQAYVMFSKGYDQSLGELLQDRGGNMKAYRVIDRQIRLTGSASRNFPGREKTKTKSVQTLGIIYKGMHLGNSL